MSDRIDLLNALRAVGGGGMPTWKCAGVLYRMCLADGGKRWIREWHDPLVGWQEDTYYTPFGRDAIAQKLLGEWLAERGIDIDLTFSMEHGVGVERFTVCNLSGDSTEWLAGGGWTPHLDMADIFPSRRDALDAAVLATAKARRKETDHACPPDVPGLLDIVPSPQQGDTEHE